MVTIMIMIAVVAVVGVDGSLSNIIITTSSCSKPNHSLGSQITPSSRPQHRYDCPCVDRVVVAISDVPCDLHERHYMRSAMGALCLPTAVGVDG